MAEATKVNISDTASMLSTYARTQRMIDSLNLVESRINSKVNISDTAAMLSPYNTVAKSKRRIKLESKHFRQRLSMLSVCTQRKNATHD